MAGKSEIEWTDATWNPIVGCSIVSPGCTNCYAMRMAARLERMGIPHYVGLTQCSKAGAVWTGKVVPAPDKILWAPLGWKKPKRIFVNSMGDLFHEAIPDEWIDRVFAVMALCPQHTFQLLTKRAERMRKYMTNPDLEDRLTELWREGNPDRETWNILLPLRNCWLGVSAERQQEADERIPLLLKTPAAVRFISAEPLLGPVDLMMLRSGDRVIDCLQGCFGRSIGDGEFEGARLCPSLDWVIAGGESGPSARPMAKVWAESLRDQCRLGDVPFFLKQMARKAPIPPDLAVREFPDTIS